MTIQLIDTTEVTEFDNTYSVRPDRKGLVADLEAVIELEFPFYHDFNYFEFINIVTFVDGAELVTLSMRLKSLA